MEQFPEFIDSVHLFADGRVNERFTLVKPLLRTLQKMADILETDVRKNMDLESYCKTSP